MSNRAHTLVPLLLISLQGASAPRADRRVVDVVVAGEPLSEARHGFVGHDVVAGDDQGRTFREARGWMRYALSTFDDTEVTIECAFVSQDSVPRRYDVIVEDSLIATRTFAAPAATSTTTAIPVPLVLTKGRTNIAVIIRAHDGPTPALRELRTIQDHNEVDLLQNLPGVTR